LLLILLFLLIIFLIWIYREKKKKKNKQDGDENSRTQSDPGTEPSNPEEAGQSTDTEPKNIDYAFEEIQKDEHE
jgi:preprotein translocase subunit SecG